MTKQFTLAVAALLAGTASAPAFAQALPDAKIAIVDADRLFQECTACKAASTQLQAQRTQLQTLAQTLAQPLQTEEQSLQTAVTAAKGQPDAALQTRIRAFQTKQQQAQQQIQTQEQTFQRNVAYVRQQIGAKIQPIVQQIAQQRGANLAMEKGGTVYAASTIEITDAVMAQLNSQLPSVSVTAPAPAAPPKPATTGR